MDAFPVPRTEHRTPYPYCVYTVLCSCFCTYPAHVPDQPLFCFCPNSRRADPDNWHLTYLYYSDTDIYRELYSTIIFLTLYTVLCTLWTKDTYTTPIRYSLPLNGWWQDPGHISSARGQPNGCPTSAETERVVSLPLGFSCVFQEISPLCEGGRL